MRAFSKCILVVASISGVLASFTTVARCDSLTVASVNFARISSTSDKAVHRILYKFDINTALLDTRIDRAILTLTLAEVQESQMFGIRVWAVAQEWNSAIAVQSMDDLATHDTISVVHLNPTAADGVTRLDVTELFSAWCSGRIPNQGMVIETLDDAASPLDVTASSALSSVDKVTVQVWYSKTD